MMDFFAEWSWLDSSGLGLFTISVLWGFYRGFIREVLGLGTWLGALCVAVYFAEELSLWFSPIIHLEQVRWVVAFVALLLVSLMVGMIITYLVSKLIDHSLFKGLDRVLGALFGICRAVFVLALAVFSLGFSSIAKEPEWKESPFVDLGENVAHYFLANIPHSMKERYGISGLESLAKEVHKKQKTPKDIPEKIVTEKTKDPSSTEEKNDK
jgi:membrane protein required for colicin V production